jgi:hypothetical protein
VARSTASFISYDLRPSKQSERRILLDVLKIAGDCGLPISDYRYVGMGANRFYDFLLIHRYIGIRNMVSLEHDPIMYKRSIFNVPYDFIDVRLKSSAQFIEEDEFSDPLVLWFDYDGGIGPGTVRDIASFSTKLKIGDFCFVTVPGTPPGALVRENDEARLAWFQDILGDVAGDVLLEDVERSAFSRAVHKVLIAAFRNAFAARRDGKFIPFLQVVYSDTVAMITVGGGLLANGQAVSFRRHLANVLPFLSVRGNLPYVIRFLHLTERERILFDRATTKPTRRSAERNELKRMGFKETEILSYKELIRYLPRYFETIV